MCAWSCCVVSLLTQSVWKVDSHDDRADVRVGDCGKKRGNMKRFEAGECTDIREGKGGGRGGGWESWVRVV